jgi:hypothetical protein
MGFRNHLRNKYGKRDVPSKTLQRIKDGFKRLNLNVTYAPVKVSNHLHWKRIWIDSLRVICEEKGYLVSGAGRNETLSTGESLQQASG